MKNDSIATINKIDNDFVIKNIYNIKINIPSSKSYLNRALILSSFQENKTKLYGISDICDDVNDMIQSLKALGVEIILTKDNNSEITLLINGNNGKFLKPKNGIINCGIGGTTSRFLLGLSALFDFDIKITAEWKMLERPISEILIFLQKIGKTFDFLSVKNHFPVMIYHHKNIDIKKIEIDGSISSQFLSSILMVSKQLDIKKIIVKNLVSKSYVNITLDVLKKFDIVFNVIKDNNKLIYSLLENKLNTKNKLKQKNKNILIEKDWSSASYFLALQYLLGIKEDILQMPKSKTQGDAKFVKIIQKIEKYKQQKDKTKPLILNMANMPDVSMTAMIICAVNNFITKITGVKTLQHKECDRLMAMQNELSKLGIITKISKNFNTITIYGNENIELKNSILIETYNDHRIAMCFAILGAKIGNIKIKNANVVSKSFKDFWKELNKFNCVKMNG